MRSASLAGVQKALAFAFWNTLAASTPLCHIHHINLGRVPSIINVLAADHVWVCDLSGQNQGKLHIGQNAGVLQERHLERSSVGAWH
jgi:hypothetical protein